MKRKIIIILILLGSVAATWIFLSQSLDKDAPRFVPVASDFQIPPYKRLIYAFSSPSPFEGGKVWVGLVPAGGKARSFLYDIEKKQVLGELVNGWPVFLNGDQTRLLLNGWQLSLKKWFTEALAKLTRGALKIGSSDREESFEVLDLRKNKYTRIGTVNHLTGSGSHCLPSPTFRYGYIRPTTGSATFVLDLEDESMEKLDSDGNAIGWWNDTGILFKTIHGDFVVYDVVKRDTSNVLQAAEIEAFLNENNFSVDFDRNRVTGFAAWDGKENQFYVTDTHKRWEATNCFLAKFEKSTGKLKLLDRDFKFEWSDKFDPTGRYYLHTPRDYDNDPRISAVFVRDTTTGETRTLVESCGDKAFSLPNWYGDSVIYFRSNMLWQIKLSQTNSTRLFPPP